MDKIASEFWRKWYGADESGKLKLVKTLTLPSKKIEDEELYKHHCASLVNSYLTDLSEYMEGLE